MPENSNVELRSEEVQEVMNRIPPAIQRWGITVMALIVAVFISIGCLVKIPVTEECRFTMTRVDVLSDTGNRIYLSRTALQSVLSGDSTEVRLRSDMFPDEYSAGILTVITPDHVSANPKGGYEATFRTPPEIGEALCKKRLTISGTATIVVAHNTLWHSVRSGLALIGCFFSICLHTIGPKFRSTTI